ncbi:MAG: hypothetical protein EPN26_08325 [Rhodospirillales bacterium]|nr:MAG: hypothetical protein EPN26_08325 [Rhodospirillales bacterium]
MRRAILLHLFFLLLAMPAWAADDAPPAAELPASPYPETLMLTPEEKAYIDLIKEKLSKNPQGAVMEAAAPPPPPPEPRPNVYLSAMVYSSATDWAAWINGMRFGPGTVQKGIRSVRASAKWVELDVDTIAKVGDEYVPGPAVRVRLSPNQTYLTKTDRVVDGLFP